MASLPDPDELQVMRLGAATVRSPLRGDDTYADEEARIFVASSTDDLGAADAASGPTFESAGPRPKLFFEPAKVSCGVVTCGGLCPGINDVIRSLVLTAHHRYGVERVVGFRYGYAGLSAKKPADPVLLGPDDVKNIHRHGGTLLGSSRGPQDPCEIVDTLLAWRISVLFCIGGDGTLRGATAIAEEVARRGLDISVIGIPKTIDNDLLWSERSFGFITAVDAARHVLEAAHTEANGAFNGVGLVKLMGRYSGSIAAHATLASGDVNFCLVPEVPFALDGPGGLFELLEKRLARRREAVIVVAEGAGQELFDDGVDPGTDASGNTKLRDIGLFLKDKIRAHFAARQLPCDIKYIDPSYIIRGMPAGSVDSAFCMVLGQHAVHAGMAGCTDMMVGFWNHAFTHVPLPLVAKGRKHFEPEDEIWQRVLDATGQPCNMGAGA